jgi:glycosyltransferase involved in cell wall biosynthesis
MLLHYIRNWDARTRDGVDHYIANSAFVARRIRKIYGRHASVIHPPVDVEAFVPGGAREDYYVTVSRLVPYKRVPLIAEAFAKMPDRKLIIVGTGPELDKVRKAAGPNVQVVGHLPFEAMRRTMQQARAFLFAAEEDFGISVVEAQACGTPVIAYGRGGALETVRDEKSAMPTGLFFAEQSVPAIIDAVERFERQPELFRPEYCRLNAEQFSADQFRESLLGFVARAQAMARGGGKSSGGGDDASQPVRDDQLDGFAGWRDG